MAWHHFDGVDASSDVSLQCELVIPQVMQQSNCRYCNVIQIFYEIVVEAHVSGCHKNLELCFPIVIGSIPIIFDQNVTSGMPMIVPQEAGNGVPMAVQFNDNFVMPPVLPPVMPPMRKLIQISFSSNFLSCTSFSSSSV